MRRKSKRDRIHVPGWMDDCLWSQLPLELLERVLPFLAVPDLCRFRSVCKAWNSIMHTPEFGNLCAQNAGKVASAGACLVFQLNEKNPRPGRQPEIPRWSILDLNAKRWYNIKHGELSEGFKSKWDEYVQDMDGGLVCTVCYISPHVSNQFTRPHRETVVISNLIDGTLEILPSPPVAPNHKHFGFNTRSTWKLVVDEVSNTYKIYLITHVHKEKPCICVYKSSINQWRKVLLPFTDLKPPAIFLINGKRYQLAVPDTRLEWSSNLTIHSVVFQELLYVLFYSPSSTINGLYSFNALKDSWEETGVQFQQSRLDFCSLVVSDKRLFLMTQLDRQGLPHGPHRRKSYPRDCPSLRISEISLRDKACRTPVVQMTEAEVRKTFSIRLHHKVTIQAFGFDKSIVLMCQETGKVMQFNLATGVWEILPKNPVERHLESQAVSLSRLGMLMNHLRLPSPPA